MYISIVVPVCDEEENIELFFEKTAEALAGCQKSFEIIFVDDGSKDNSWDSIERLAKKRESVKGISFDRNYGKTSACDAGFKKSCGDYIFTIDCDMQYDPRDILLLLGELENNDVDAVFGKRINRTAGWIKKMSSVIAISVRSWILDETYSGSSFAGYKRKCLDGLVLYRGFQDFIPVLMQGRGFVTKEIDVFEHPRKHGTSKYGIRNRLFKGLLTLFIIRWMKKSRLKYKIVKDGKEE